MSPSVNACPAQPATAIRRGVVIFLPHLGLGLIRCDGGRVVAFVESSVVGDATSALRLGDGVRVVERCGTPSWVETVVVMRRRTA